MNDCIPASGLLAESGADPLLLTGLLALAVLLIAGGLVLTVRAGGRGRRGRLAGGALLLAVAVAGGGLIVAPSSATAAESCPAVQPQPQPEPQPQPGVETRLDVFGASAQEWAGTHDRVPETVGLYDPEQERGTDTIPLETALAQCDTDYVPGPVPMWLILVDAETRVIAWRTPIRSAEAEPQQFVGIPLGTFDVYLIPDDRAVGDVLPEGANIGVNSARTWQLTNCDVEWEGTILTEGAFTTGIIGWVSASVGEGIRAQVTAAHPVLEVRLLSNLP